MKIKFHAFSVLLVLVLFCIPYPLIAGPFENNSLSGISAVSVSTGDTSTASEIPVVEDSLLRKANQNIITGAFFQFWGSDNDKQASDWEKELSAMRAIGMDTIIIQSNQSSGVNFSEATELVLEEADKTGMNVFIGTALNEDGWYSNRFNPVYLHNAGKDVAKYTEILVKQFSPHKSFVGLYIPYEENTMASAVLMGEFYGKISKAAKNIKPELKVLISPFTAVVPQYSISMPAWRIKNYFETLFKRGGIDICALQDGIGCSSGRLEKISEDLTAISEACKNTGVEFWANVEIFEPNKSKDPDSFKFIPANMDRISKQISAEGPFATKIICFDFNHYFSPNSGNELAQKLYNDYLDYIESK
ncbi:MAG: DUF4434 domain-containing protein [Candidatus Riflebacteria bacterium]|nr:DUF4434 domain-containing protein [Candidatus Riflebacteria bacterium]